MFENNSLHATIDSPKNPNTRRINLTCIHEGTSPTNTMPGNFHFFPWMFETISGNFCGCLRLSKLPGGHPAPFHQ